MINIDGMPIFVEELAIIEKLRIDLSNFGRNSLFKINPTQGNIMVTCPFHGNGQERKPSCGISTRDRKRPDGRIIPAGTVHCFTCGYTEFITKFVSECFGVHDNGEYGKRWLVENFITVTVGNRRNIAFTLSRTEPVSRVAAHATEAELANYRYYHDYMWKRGLTPKIVEMFDVGYDHNFVIRSAESGKESILHCLTFPVRDENGNLIMVARRSVDTKFFHYPSGAFKPIYGLWEVKKYFPDTKEIIICESILNALTCWRNNRPAVALLGLGSSPQYDILRRFPVRKYISGFDPDGAGMKATLKLSQELKGIKLVTKFIVPPGKDINDLTDEEFCNLSEYFC